MLIIFLILLFIFVLSTNTIIYLKAHNSRYITFLNEYIKYKHNAKAITLNVMRFNLCSYSTNLYESDESIFTTIIYKRVYYILCSTL